MSLPPNFESAIDQLTTLSDQQRYLSVLIFGSAARGDVSAKSDLDVKVIVDRSDCQSISHPFINDIKLDISFLSIEQLTEATHKEITKGERIPIVAESLILFDKTGAVNQLKHHALTAKPKQLTKTDESFIQFLIYHIHAKAERHVDTDPDAALLVMHTSLNDLIKYHYQINQRWLVSDKRLLIDLRTWDAKASKILSELVNTANYQSKYQLFEQLIDYILQPLGGRLPISENNCTCKQCQQDLQVISSL